jgi:serine/threonine-protein kinase
VAIKIISERAAADKAARERFLGEARAMATVEHPHIVRIYSFAESAGTAYLVMCIRSASFFASFSPGSAIRRIQPGGANGASSAFGAAAFTQQAA